MAPGTPHIQNQNTSAKMTSTGFNVKRRASRLLRCRQFEQAQTALVITVLRELAEGQPALFHFLGEPGAQQISRPPLGLQV